MVVSLQSALRRAGRGRARPYCKCNVAVCRALVEAGTNATPRNAQGQTALDLARAAGVEPGVMVELLVGGHGSSQSRRWSVFRRVPCAMASAARGASSIPEAMVHSAQDTVGNFY